MECVFNNISEYIFVINNKGSIKYCNRSLLDKLGYVSKDIHERNICDILCDQDNVIEKILNNKDELSIDLDLYSKSNKIIKVTSKIVLGKWNQEESIFIISKDISEKYYTKKDLENLLDIQPIAYWIKDLEGKYLYVNTPINASTYNKGMIGIYDYEYDLLNKDDLLKYNQMDKEIIENKIPKVIEKNIDNKWFEMHRSPIVENGEVKYITGAAREITLEKRMKHEIYKNNKYASNLHNVLNKSNKENNLYEILNNISCNIKDYLEVDGLALFLYDKSRGTLEAKVKLGKSKKALEEIQTIKLTKELIDNLLKKKDYEEGLNHIDNLKYMPNREYLKKNSTEYIGIYNIIADDEYIGMLAFGYGKKNKLIRNMNDNIKSICSELGIIINNFRLSQEVNEELNRRIEVEKELELFLDIATDLVGIVDINGKFKKVSNQWTTTLGWSRDELLSMKYNELVHKSDLKNKDNLDGYIEYTVKENYKKEAVHTKHRALCKNNEYKWLDIKFRYIEDRNEYIITASDITEEKKLEEERIALQERIHLESIKNEFFANISHEFKTPLNIILGTIQLIEKYAKKENMNNSSIVYLNQYTKPIKQNSYRLLRLVNNLIDMTRIDSGYYDLNIDNNNIVSTIEDITMSVTQYVENKGINLIFDTNKEELILACDVDKIERIMLNLMSNAIKYTDNNGKIIVNLDCREDKVRISVKDNGIGISKEKIDMIFERFGQVDNSLTRRCEGSGIGLSLVKSLVEMHNGTIEVYSKVGRGSEFIFELPVKVVKGKKKLRFNGDKIDLQIERCNVEFSDIYSL